jgi:hypothetical protein
MNAKKNNWGQIPINFEIWRDEFIWGQIKKSALRHISTPFKRSDSHQVEEDEGFRPEKGLPARPLTTRRSVCLCKFATKAVSPNAQPLSADWVNARS